MAQVDPAPALTASAPTVGVARNAQGNNNNDQNNISYHFVTNNKFGKIAIFFIFYSTFNEVEYRI